MTSIILTGATGTAGSAVLTNALASPLISHVTVLARRAPAVKSEKLTTIIIPSDEYPRGFDEIPSTLVERLRGSDAVVWALGISQTQVNKDEFHKITYDYAMAGANAFKTLGTKDKPFRFVFMSGMGTTQDKPGMFTPLFAIEKGAVERELRAMETDIFKTVMVRPGGILPAPDHTSNVPLISRLGGAVASVVWPSAVIKSTDLADACLDLAVGKGWDARTPEHTIENEGLKKLAADYHASMSL
ncbi:hypothetical protein CspHIS471_0301720 [Cutaneotrichosporon sp. HIS471]|nr:hypothetical protein CspHIS471_0301720 [Cutaneotrichosporon sp. HIS471]